jgi:hypothetical protein
MDTGINILAKEYWKTNKFIPELYFIFPISQLIILHIFTYRDWTGQA